MVHVEEDVIDLGGDHCLLDTLCSLLVEQSPVSSGDASTLPVLHHEAVGSQPGVGHHTLLGRLHISSLLIIQISTEASDKVPQSMLESGHLSGHAVSTDLHSMPDCMDLK